MKEETKTFEDHIQPFLRQKWLILACMVVVVIPTLIVLMNTRHSYKATATLLIEQSEMRVLDLNGVLASDPESQNYFETQVLLLESADVARSVIQELHLDQHPDFVAEREEGQGIIRFNIREALANVIQRVLPKRTAENEGLTEDEIKDPLFPIVVSYMDRLDIAPLERSRLVNISFETHDPRLAARVANAHAEAYIQKQMAMHLYASKEATRWLEAQLEEVEKKVRESEQALQGFTREEGILPFTNAQGEGDEENIILGHLAELNAALAEARTKRAGLETLLSQLKEFSKTPGLMESIPEISSNPLIQQLKVSYSEQSRLLMELKGKYGERHPRMVAIKQEMANLMSRINTEVTKIAKGVEVQYKVALAEEENLREEFESARRAGMEFSGKTVEFYRLKQEVDSNRQIAEMLRNRAKETQLESGLRTSNLFIVDHAGVPQVPSKPKKKEMLLLAVLAGLSLGMGLTMFLEHLDTSFHGPDEVKRHLGVPFLGPVGLASSKNSAEGSSELQVIQEPRSHFAECLRNIATNIIFSLPETNQKSLIVTSSNPFEGKTLIGSNLAVLLAEMGRKVLYVDADMRVPRVHNVFQVPLEPGLSNLVFRTCPVEEPLRDTKIRLLKVLPAGTIPPNPAAILSSSAMKWLIQQYKKEYDLILFDTPPVLSAADASLLGGTVDGVLLVLQAATTRRDSVKRALEQLNHVRASVLGAILNRVDFKRDRYYYSYYSHYNYYYTPEGRKKYRRKSA